MVEVKSPVIPTYPHTVGVGHTIDKCIIIVRKACTNFYGHDHLIEVQRSLVAWRSVVLLLSETKKWWKMCKAAFVGFLLHLS